jgi:MerR family copper efflux transcriptional regulator
VPFSVGTAAGAAAWLDAARPEKLQSYLPTMASPDPRAAGEGGNRLLQIGEVAERADLSLRTLRYWEEVGLVTPSARTGGGFRLYSEADLERILLIKLMRPLGLTLEELGELADLIEDTEMPVSPDDNALRHLVYALGSYSSRADEAIGKLGRELSGTRQLQLRIGESLRRCQAMLEQRGGAIVDRTVDRPEAAPSLPPNRAG